MHCYILLYSEEYEPDAKPIQAATSLDGSEATSLSKLSSEQYGNLVSFVRCGSDSVMQLGAS